MSRKQRRSNRQKKAKQRNSTPIEKIPVVVEPEDLPQSTVHNDSERFVFANEIAERLGVTPTCVRKWRTEGKIALRKLFGSTWPYGMSETELVKLIRGEFEG